VSNSAFGWRMTRNPDQAGLFGDDPPLRPVATESRALTVPFGKFKGEPVDLLLAHADYALWLLTAKAALLRKSHPPLYHWLIGHFGAPDTTPEHNRLQNRFLEEDFCLQLYLHLNPGVAEKPRQYTTASAFINGWKNILSSRVGWANSCGVDAAQYGGGGTPDERAVKVRQKALEVLQRDIDKVVLVCPKKKRSDNAGRTGTEPDAAGATQSAWNPVFSAADVQFEVDGADVQFKAGGSISLYVDENPSYGREVMWNLLNFSDIKHFRVEVKPFVGDDYPVILRSMTTKKCNVLLVEAFEADGASWEQVKKVFASRGIQVALLEDVLLTPIPDYARELPLPSIDRAEMMRLATIAFDEHVAKAAAAKAKALAKFGGDF